MISLNYTAGSRKPIAIRVDLKPRHRGSDTAHMRRTARCPSRQLRRTAEMAGVLSFAGARANGEVAPIPAIRGTESAALSDSGDTVERIAEKRRVWLIPPRP